MSKMIKSAARNCIPMNLRFFGEGDDLNPVVQPEPNQQTPNTPSANYEDLINTDKSLQSFVDKRITEATRTAVSNAMQKQQRLNDEKLSESERLKEMTAEQRALYFEQKYRDTEKARARDKEIESLKSQTVSMLTENNIPDVFLDVFEFDNATAEDIRQRVSMLSDYEYYPKGELEKRITAAVNEKLKQTTPETHMSGGANNPTAQAKTLNEALKQHYK